MEEIESYIRQKFAENAGITVEQFAGEGVTLADVMAMSTKMTNSIDLMESFARTANGLRKDYGVRVRLPALPLDTPIPVVLKTFLEEYERQREQQEEAQR
ncbi:MAG TPA: hypothetical protein VGS97_17570 [Actinocrinis sp.]|uniref:hypothetical protein n=1 Tax=Actinocrinis sp. TaxID=1920516 RepID=UPI002DDCCA0B|nr:hypothetical protein [Actinocrinis sp.]HEV2345912.1 hypothetical protein [Actinocrinis sp.]